MKLSRGQHLFEALQNVCGFIALESDMDEIISAIELDNQGNSEDFKNENEK